MKKTTIKLPRGSANKKQPSIFAVRLAPDVRAYLATKVVDGFTMTGFINNAIRQIEKCEIKQQSEAQPQ